MKNKILLIAVIILLPFSLISFFKKETNFNLSKKVEIRPSKKDPITIIIKKSNNIIEKINLEDYVIGVVAGEMPASFEMAALEAQAIASRTYALYKKEQNKDYDVTDTVSDQVYLDKTQLQEKWQSDYEYYLKRITTAVKDTEGLVMKYDNKLIKAYYFAMSNGYTEDAINVFNEQQDYLTTVDSPQEESFSNNIIKTISFSKEEFCMKLQIDCSNINISNITRNNSNRIQQITINNKTYTGVEIRKKLNLRSTDFTINVNDENIQITTNGYGHGVGMSQYGANALAKQNHSYSDILKHYYQKITIEKY